MKKYGKFVALVVVVLGALSWLAFTGSTDSKSYYKTISELGKMGDQAYSKRIRVGGDVEDGSIQHVNNAVVFTLKQDKLELKVVYSGTDPLPDTFRGGAQALADGKMGSDGAFHATQIQAKCASKYEARPGLKPGQALPNINTNPAKSI
jgi:cytochrome c-type biogenesis protein CcmE